MKYTLFLYSNEAQVAAAPPAALQQVKSAFEAYTQSLKDAGVFVTTDWLRPSTTATTLSLRDGVRRIQDGPYADSKEQLGGFYVIDVPNLDDALRWAERCPAAQRGLIEVRPSAMG
jgi:hypothetical protein